MAISLATMIICAVGVFIDISVITVAPIAGILMAGATVIDSLPHGSFFHATGGAAGLEIKERMKLIPYEMCVGLTSTVVAVMMYVI